MKKDYSFLLFFFIGNLDFKIITSSTNSVFCLLSCCFQASLDFFLNVYGDMKI